MLEYGEATLEANEEAIGKLAKLMSPAALKLAEQMARELCEKDE